MINLLKIFSFCSFIIVSGSTINYNRDGRYLQNKVIDKELRVETRAGPPCPDDALITPCTCVFSSVDLSMRMDCSLVNSEDELRAIMNQDFDPNAFYELRIDHEDTTSNLTQLTSGVFGQNTFGKIVFAYTGVVTIDPDVFVNMQDTLYFLSIFKGDLTSFVQDFTLFSQFSGIYLNYNVQLTELSVISPSTTDFESMDDSSLTSDKFYVYLPNVWYMMLFFNAFTEIPDLSSATKVTDLYLEGNMITTIKKGDLCHSPILNFIRLFTNGLTTVEADSICVVPGSYINMASNGITTLEESIWGPIVSNAAEGDLSLASNPLVCGCDVKWIFEQNLERNIYATCPDGSLFWNLDQSIFDSCP